jgi:glycosyltransferase involved in cell wall biosynthesis
MRNSNDVVVVCFPFIGDFIGGSHFSALGLIQNLDRSKFFPLVVLHQPDGPVADMFRREGVEFEIAPVLNRLDRAGRRNAFTVVKVVRTLPAIVKFLTARKVSIVHTNDGRTHVVWGIAARLAGLKHLWHHRGDASSFGLNWIAPWLSNRVVAVSKFASPRPGILSASRKSVVVHSPFDVGKLLGIDRANARSMVQDEIGCAVETTLIGYVGTLVDRKRPLVFVEALAALKRIAPETKFAGLFLGSALDKLDDAAKLRAEELGISENIHLMGFRFPGEPWIAGLDVLLVTAVNEPLGRTLVEAMLLGTPVIAADSGGSPEAIEDGVTGILVKPDAPDEFAKACLRLIQDPSYDKQITETARSSARSLFSIERHVSAITKVYDSLVGATIK